MTRVLLIANASTPAARAKAGEFVSRIGHELGDEFEIEHCPITELFFELKQDAIDIYHPDKHFNLRDFDLIIIRHVGKCWVEAHAITLFCEHHGIRYTDTYLNRLLLDNKLSTQYLLWTNGIRQWPRTMYGPTHELMARMHELGERAVLKDNMGLKGRLNFVVSSPEEIKMYVDQNPDTHFLLQEFIPNDSDFRVLVMNDKPVMVIRRHGAEDTHLNNTSQGGTAEVVPVDSIDAHILETCVRAAQVAKLQVAGVDVMFNQLTGDFVLLEINNAPQISSGSFVEQKVQVYAQMVRELTGR